MARRRLLITYIATYLVAIGTIVRYLTGFGDELIWSIALLLGGYLILLFSEPILIRQNHLLTYIYLIIQTAIICTISLISPNVDFWAALFFPLVLQTMQNFPQRTGFLITGMFTLIMAILMLLGPGPDVGLPLILINGVVYFFLAAFIAIIREAEAAREESEKQQAELRSAHQQLQSYTTQTKELAVLQERSRLARELHDSVTQSLYSLTLFTEAARHKAEEKDDEEIEQYIRQIGVIGQQALKEMRLLVYELQPPELEREGLVRALRKRLEAVEGRAGVDARLEVDEFVNLPGDIEHELYRIAQEALNNTLKHAAAGSVVVYLHQSNGSIMMEIADDGIGFNSEDTPDRGGLGLNNIRDRVERIGGSVTIDSQPGGGTRVKVSVPQSEVNNQ
jgi:signal transduction histidine kinase